MSTLSKILLKLISGIMIVILAVASIPIFINVYHGLASNFKLTFAWAHPPQTPTVSIPSIVIPPTETSTGAIPVVNDAYPAATSPGPTETAPEIPSLTPTTADPSPTEVVPQGSISSGGNGLVTLSLPIIRNGSSIEYKVQDGTPIFIQNFAHASAGCQWMSVAGQVFDSTSNPAKNLVVNISGTLNGQTIDLLGVTGNAEQYGAGGYDIQLGTTPIASTGTLSIQLFDLSGKPLSEKMSFDTSADCSQNVVLINFY